MFLWGEGGIVHIFYLGLDLIIYIIKATSYCLYMSGVCIDGVSTSFLLSRNDCEKCWVNWKWCVWRFSLEFDWEVGCEAWERVGYHHTTVTYNLFYCFYTFNALYAPWSTHIPDTIHEILNHTLRPCGIFCLALFFFIRLSSPALMYEACLFYHREHRKRSGRKSSMIKFVRANTFEYGGVFK